MSAEGGQSIGGSVIKDLDTIDSILAEAAAEDAQARLLELEESGRMLDWLADHWIPGRGDAVEKAFFEGDRISLCTAIRNAWNQKEEDDAENDADRE